MLRILNAVRLPDVGIPLTYAQYCETGVRALVDRLINMNHHRLAAKITSKAGFLTEQFVFRKLFQMHRKRTRKHRIPNSKRMQKERQTNVMDGFPSGLFIRKARACIKC